MKLNFKGDVAEIAEGISLIAERAGFVCESSGIPVEVEKTGDGFCIIGSDGKYSITYGTKAEFFRGLSFLTDKIKKGEKDFKFTQQRKIETSGFMLDLSRCAVVTVDSAKELIERVALMGVNMIMLYTEDVYKLDNYPYFGYMRGAYTKEELKEIDAYALKFGIEMIPCIQTLAHLGAVLRWKETAPYKDTPYTLLVGADETYTFIEEMIKTCREIFTTDRIHIGMDESFDLGTGQYFKRNGFVPTHEIMDQHLKRVSEIVNKYNYKPMMWSDMFFTSCNIEKYYYTPETQFPEDFVNDIPENLEMVYWDYEGNDEARYDSMHEAHKRLKHDVVFAGALWSWNRLAPNYQKSFLATRAALASCKKYDVQTAFMTVWGNGGTQAHMYTMLPAIQLWADLTYSDNVSDEELAANFKACTGYNLDDFLLLSCDDFDIEDIKKNLAPDCLCINTSIQIFYQDLLFGLLDKTLSSYDFKSHYKEYLDKISALSDMGDMTELFDIYKVLYSILVKKSDMGIRLTDAYRSGNKEELANIIAEAKVMLGEIGKYHALNYKLWHKTYRPFGWEQFDGKLGSLESRVTTAINRVTQYLAGEIASLPEFEAERLYFDGYDKPFIEVGGVLTFDRPCTTD